MDSLTPRRGVDSHTARGEEGYLRGAVSLPVDEIGKVLFTNLIFYTIKFLSSKTTVRHFSAICYCKKVI